MNTEGQVYNLHQMPREWDKRPATRPNQSLQPGKISTTRSGPRHTLNSSQQGERKYWYLSQNGVPRSWHYQNKFCRHVLSIIVFQAPPTTHTSYAIVTIHKLRLFQQKTKTTVKQTTTMENREKRCEAAQNDFNMIQNCSTTVGKRSKHCQNQSRNGFGRPKLTAYP